MNEKETLNFINMMATKNEKLKWTRLKATMVNKLELLTPIEEKVLELILEKVPIMDDITNIRNEMIEICIHPKEYLVFNDTHVLCKFCNKRIGLPHKLKDS